MFLTSGHHFTHDTETEYLFRLLLQENCSACSQVPLDLHFPPSSKLQEVLDYLTESASLYVSLPDITTLLRIMVMLLFLTLHYIFYFILFSRQMKSPALTATIEGKSKTLYLQVKSYFLNSVQW